MSGTLIQETPFQTITVKELHPTFGAEVFGVDFDNASDEQLHEIVAAMAKYGFCVFRNTGLTDDTHVSFSWRLGDLDNIKRYMTPGRKLRYRYFELFDASNLDDNNHIIDPDSPRAHYGRGNRLWHTDSSFNPRRASFSLLRAVALPPKETGGNTDFADSRTAWDELPEAVKTSLLANDWIGAYSLPHSRKIGSPEFFHDIDPWQSPMARHKIVQRHEASGRMNLYTGTHLHHLEDHEGNVPENSAELVALLNEHATQDSLTVSIEWDKPGDLVIWDNTAVLHRAGRWDGEGKYARDLRRTTVHDSSPTAWGMNEIGTQMPTMASISATLGMSRRVE
ncbi:alpha-ketoglutarate-dependent 2,4-dichlorophenoxyacetate dioxygenase [Podospora didyma]|uniref:Alpha-ketoglutarate-dependent 2,4-dichlorophenoxyacetate dioxygenase n=1 Tax=Podospora didyma TaxID=330526 RepID=A0AAE0NT70_9PEZI|nr:alpha-ketoglutarate-dependent 2,4-dichlorophenoxyacetate dioxygenase [Podospora didyma]